jgi:hypothetical protein
MQQVLEAKSLLESPICSGLPRKYSRALTFQNSTTGLMPGPIWIHRRVLGPAVSGALAYGARVLAGALGLGFRFRI